MSIIIDLNNDFKRNCENKDVPESHELGIKFFNDNSVAFYNVTKLDSEEDVIAYKELFWKYIYALSQKGRLNDVLNFTLKVIPILDNGLEKFNVDHSKDDWYKGIIRINAEAAYGLKDYKIALKEYKILYKLDPQNEALKKWIDYCSIGLRSRFNTRLGIVSFACILISMLLISYKPRSIGLSFLYIGFIGFGVILLTEWYNQRSRRRYVS